VALNIDRKYLEPISRIEFLARQVVEGFITGLHKSPFHGFSVEFAEHRQYNKGESTKHIDWKLFGRTEKLFIKRFEEETNLRCQIVIDGSSSMLFPFDTDNNDIKKLNKLGFSAYAAAALIHLLKKQLDAIGLSVFNENVFLQTPAKSTPVHIKLLYSELEKLLSAKPDDKVHKTDVIKSIHTIAESIHKRSLVIIFSDMFDNGHQLNEIMGALQHLKYNKHEVLFFHTLSNKLERDFNFENRPYTFIDSETREEVKLNPTQVKESFKLHMQEFNKELKAKCAGLKIDYIDADIDQGFEKILQAYLIKRSSML
jgi:uncharacterized protein (DUF58 family)